MKEPPKITSDVLGIEDLSSFDWDSNHVFVVERVIKKGWPDDFEEMVKYYGWGEVRMTILSINNFSSEETAFVSAAFQFTQQELKRVSKE